MKEGKGKIGESFPFYGESISEVGGSGMKILMSNILFLKFFASIIKRSNGLENLFKILQCPSLMHFFVFPHIGWF